MVTTQKARYSMKNEKWFDRELLKKMAKIGIPIILMSMMFGLTELSDNLSLGIWGGKHAVAAAGLAGRIYWMGFMIISVFSTIFEFIIAQYFGAKEYEKEKAAMRAAILFSVISAIIFIIIVNIWTKDILGLFIKNNTKSNVDTLNMANKYIKVLIWLFLLEGITRAYESGIISEGQTKIPTIITLSSILPNFFFNWLFINYTPLGYLGCAVSTIVVWTTVVISLGVWLFIEDKKENIHFAINPITIFYQQDWKVIKLGFSRTLLGLSMVLNELIVITALSFLSRKYGSEGVAITSMISPFFNILLFAGAGVISTKSYFVTKNLGANNLKTAYVNDCKLNLYATILAIINALFLCALAYPIPLIYHSQSSQIQTQSTYCIISIAISYIFIITASSFSASLNAGGKALQKFLATSVPGLIFEVLIFGLIINFISWDDISYFWIVYGIYRGLKTFKLLVTYFFWRRKDWVINVVGKNDGSKPSDKSNPDFEDDVTYETA